MFQVRRRVIASDVRRIITLESFGTVAEVILEIPGVLSHSCNIILLRMKRSGTNLDKHVVELGQDELP